MAVKIFFCYAHEDEALLNKLKSHLKPMQREGLIEGWHDRDIGAGKDWEKEISSHLNESQIILLLISPDFMASDYCSSVEMKRALDRRARNEAEVIPIILRPTFNWHVGPLGALQALPTDGKPVTDPEWHDQDQAFYRITNGLHKVIEQLSRIQAITALETDIEMGAFESGTPLKEIPLAKQYNVTPEAVYEALIVLEAGGFIRHLPDQGYASYDVKLHEAEDIYQIREVLEGLASRLFCLKAPPDRVIELEKAIDAFAEAARRPDQKDALLSAKNHVYEVLFQGCNNKLLYSLFRSLRDRISYLRKQTLSRPGRPEQTHKELRAILDAIKKRNPEKAEQASIMHVRNAANVAYDELQNQSNASHA